MSAVGLLQQSFNGSRISATLLSDGSIPCSRRANHISSFVEYSGPRTAGRKPGYHRYWLAEHHNILGIASAATSVMIGQVAARTKTIRVGAGGIMLPNHSPLIIAEQFGTLATLFPDRIDLGVGRAPGTDANTARALRRHMQSGDQFPQDVQELLSYFDDAPEGTQVRAIPGEGTHVPIWILGSSLYGAQLAAYLGLPYAFASHFAPQMLGEALHIYRSTFQPSKSLTKPYVIIGAGVCGADTEEEATYLRSSQVLAFARMHTGQRGKLPLPVDDLDAEVPDHIRLKVEQSIIRIIVAILSQVQFFAGRYS